MRRGRIVRGAAGAVVGLLAIGTLMVPASAHVNSPLTFKHLKKHFYTKGQSDARFWNVGELGSTIEDKFDEPAIFSSFKNGPIDTPETLGTIASLSVPTGVYAINAKLYIEDATQFVVVQCDLLAGGDLDRVKGQNGPGAGEDFVPLALQVVHTFAAPGTIELKCLDGVPADAGTKANFIKITAIRGSSLSNVASA